MKKTISVIITITVIFSFQGNAYSLSSDDRQEESSGGGTGQALLGAIGGTLLGAGLGAAIGSASGKAGTGAAIGAGIGALGGTLIAADKEKRDRQARAEERYEENYAYSRPAPAVPVRESPTDIKYKKKIIREYDSDGNVISEKEVKN